MVQRSLSTPELTGTSPHSAGRDDEGDPKQLWLLAPARGAVQGEYVLQKGRDNFDQPLWRQQKGSGWLFSSGPDGFWRFANSDMELADRLGPIQSAQPHTGLAPHKVVLWQYYDGSGWHDDTAISVFASHRKFAHALAQKQSSSDDEERPSSLWLLTRRYPNLQGEYRKQETRRERGEPVWRQVGGEGWIFSTSKGRWFVTDSEQGITQSGGVMASAAPHNGVAPNKIEQWQFFSEGSWQPDAAILLTDKQAEAERLLAEQQREALLRSGAAPERVWIICPPKPLIQGEYCRQPGRIERGHAVWRQVGGSGILYSNGLGGLWCVATKEADVQKNLGVLQCSTPHQGRPPQEMEAWQYADGSAWRLHKDLRVTDQREEGLAALAEQEALARRRADLAPKHLWLKAPSKAVLQGEYTKVPDRLERSQALWQQAAGPGWLYSTTGGRWFFTDREEGIALNTGLLASNAPHQGRLPQETEKWQEFVDGAWQLAPSVIVVADVECLHIRGISMTTEMEGDFEALASQPMPYRLWLVCPEKAELEGEYVLSTSQTQTWQQENGCGFLFSHQDGSDAPRWAVAESRDAMVNCRPCLRGAWPHGRAPPQETRWQLREGATWREAGTTAALASPQVVQTAEVPELAPDPKPDLSDTRLVEDSSPSPSSFAEPMPTPAPYAGPKKVLDSPGESFMEAYAPAPEVLTPSSLHALSGSAAIPMDLRRRVSEEVQALLARANLDFSQGEVDADALVEECCMTLLHSHEDGVEIPHERLSAEVVRTILQGWDQLRRRGLDPEPQTVSQRSRFRAYVDVQQAMPREPDLDDHLHPASVCLHDSNACLVLSCRNSLACDPCQVS